MPCMDKSTLVALRKELQTEFQFDDFDPCCFRSSHCPDYDGRDFNWASKTFCNPSSYSQLESTKKKFGWQNGVGWVEKAHNECQKGKLIVLLLPARTDATWFHDIILKHDYEVRFLGDKSMLVIMNGISDGKLTTEEHLKEDMDTLAMMVQCDFGIYEYNIDYFKARVNELYKDYTDY